MEGDARLGSADVEAALEGLGLETRVLTFDDSTATAPEAAEAIGTALGSIVKSLCFVVAGQPVIVLTAGDRRVDDRKLSALYGVGRKKVKIADAETTIATTGYGPGGVPPVGHRRALPVWIDETLARFEIVYAAAGSENAIFAVPYETLVEITGGSVGDVAKA
jgi:prolyl-tRNA editing enzyme YbaK/EbsC (Cys-tRNA(Pro) deacylase)